MLSFSNCPAAGPLLSWTGPYFSQGITRLATNTHVGDWHESAKAMWPYRTFQPLAGPGKDFIRKIGKGGNMKPQRLKKPHNDKSDTTQAAIPEQLMSDDLRERIAKRAYQL